MGKIGRPRKLRRDEPINNSGLPTLPPIPEAFLVRHKGELQGELHIGEVVAWEPDTPWARELAIITKIENGMIATANLYGDHNDTHWNDESRFREACCRTTFKLMRP